MVGSWGFWLFLAVVVGLRIWSKTVLQRDALSTIRVAIQIALSRWLQQVRRHEPAFEDLDRHDVPEEASGHGTADLIVLNAALARLRAPERLCVGWRIVKA